VASPLSAAQTAEIEELAARYGPTRRVVAAASDAFGDPVRRADRVGEVCFVVRRPAGTLLLSTKTFYPPGAYRLPTGGMGPDEAIFDALLRETAEETGLDVHVERFLAHIAYRPEGRYDATPFFHTFVFLLRELGGTLATADPHERIAGYREVAVSELPAVAEALRRVADVESAEIEGRWGDWGRFRAVVHDVVHEALKAR
jgi:8-oxo-dGTP pyrophosphatase MutT (NUDIX family)